jgi:aryl-alcohol dehydrogenase-like predicted oxidoreductase
MFILGTANFGNSYGGSKTIIDISKAAVLLDNFKKSNGILIDSALNYGQSLNIIKETNLEGLTITTKIPTNILHDFDLLDYHLNWLDINYKNKISYLLLHDTSEIELVPNKSIYRLMCFLEQNNSIKFGVSIYFYDELLKALDIFPIIQHVQAPLNYFDRRFIDNVFIKFCHEKKLSLHYRSIFLQGKLLQNSEQLNKYFKQFEQFNYYYQEVEKKKYKNLLEFNLRFIRACVKFDKIILGVENIIQMQEIVNMINYIDANEEHYDFKDIIFDDKLSIPMNWKLI